MSTPAELKIQADEFKTLGNLAYKERKFDEAIINYNKAWELNKDITYLNNLSAVYFEQADYDKTIATAEKAIEEGREIRADYKLIAKAFARIGTAQIKLDNYEEGIKSFTKSLAEHRTPEVLTKLKEAEKAKSERDRLAYIDPVLSDKAREEGNVAFKSGDLPKSVTLYTESIKRNPEDARGYTNRAAALTKLLALPEALKDAEKAIEVQPDFIKGYIRKSHVLFAMKEYGKSLQAIELAATKDTLQKHTSEIASQIRKVNLADSADRVGETDEQAYARAMRDPEIQAIMSDPVFQNILQQAQNEPESLGMHMKNEGIREKINKLVRAGIIKTR